jgi:hypothetical protein
MIDGVIEGSSPADVIFMGCTIAAPRIARKAVGDEPAPSHAPIAGRRCLRARSKKTPGSDRMADRFERIDTRQKALLPQEYP